jgi:alkylhydroperoxidase/carboxymuconolactone decarboxylase family protein YurZ
MKKNSTMELFKKEAPKVAEAFDNLIQKSIQTDGLDQKTKQLI